MIDQIRAIDAKRLIKRLGKLPQKSIQEVRDNILIVLNLEPLKTW
jgi:mRNA interferase MazF